MFALPVLRQRIPEGTEQIQLGLTCLPKKSLLLWRIRATSCRINKRLLCGTNVTRQVIDNASVDKAGENCWYLTARTADNILTIAPSKTG